MTEPSLGRGRGRPSGAGRGAHATPSRGAPHASRGAGIGRKSKRGRGHGRRVACTIESPLVQASQQRNQDLKESYTAVATHQRTLINEISERSLSTCFNDAEFEEIPEIARLRNTLELHYQKAVDEAEFEAKFKIAHATAELRENQNLIRTSFSRSVEDEQEKTLTSMINKLHVLEFLFDNGLPINTLDANSNIKMVSAKEFDDFVGITGDVASNCVDDTEPLIKLDSPDVDVPKKSSRLLSCTQEQQQTDAIKPCSPRDASDEDANSPVKACTKPVKARNGARASTHGGKGRGKQFKPSTTEPDEYGARLLYKSNPNGSKAPQSVLVWDPSSNSERKITVERSNVDENTESDLDKNEVSRHNLHPRYGISLPESRHADDSQPQQMVTGLNPVVFCTADGRIHYSSRSAAVLRFQAEANLRRRVGLAAKMMQQSCPDLVGAEITKADKEKCREKLANRLRPTDVANPPIGFTDGLMLPPLPLSDVGDVQMEDVPTPQQPSPQFVEGLPAQQHRTFESLIAAARWLDSQAKPAPVLQQAAQPPPVLSRAYDAVRDIFTTLPEPRTPVTVVPVPEPGPEPISTLLLSMLADCAAMAVPAPLPASRPSRGTQDFLSMALNS